MIYDLRFTIWWKRTALALILSPLTSPFSPCLAQGSLTPPGAPTPTMKTLDQIEPRIPISSLPVTITQPGSYYLTGNFDLGTGQDGIDVSALNVTIDLNGFTIRSFDSGNTAAGIRIDPLSGYMANLTILNGHIVGSVLNVGGVYAGSGFGYGIYCSGSPRNVRIAGVTVSGCTLDGINVGMNSTVVDSCAVSTVGGSGIVADLVTGSTAYQCGGSGIAADTASHCRGDSTGSATGILANTVAEACQGTSVNGEGVAGASVTGCSGSSSSSYGISASSAGHCVAQSGSSYGIVADSATDCSANSTTGTAASITTANNCAAISYGAGDGLDANVANNCYGQSYSGTGLYTYYSANNCQGVCWGSGTGMFSYFLAIGCYGSSSTGTALSAFIANSCYGSPASITYRYNMP